MVVVVISGNSPPPTSLPVSTLVEVSNTVVVDTNQPRASTPTSDERVLSIMTYNELRPLLSFRRVQAPAGYVVRGPDRLPLQGRNTLHHCQLATQETQLAPWAMTCFLADEPE